MNPSYNIVIFLFYFQAIFTYEQSTIDCIVMATVSKENLLAGSVLLSPYIALLADLCVKSKLAETIN